MFCLNLRRLVIKPNDKQVIMSNHKHLLIIKTTSQAKQITKEKHQVFKPPQWHRFCTLKNNTFNEIQFQWIKQVQKSICRQHFSRPAQLQNLFVCICVQRIHSRGMRYIIVVKNLGSHKLKISGDHCRGMVILTDVKDPGLQKFENGGDHNLL